MEQELGDVDSPWTYVLRPRVRDQVKELFLSRCGSELHSRLDGNTIHLTTLLQLIQYIWHTVDDLTPIDPVAEQLLKTEEVKIRRRGDVIVQECLSSGGMAGKGHIMYMLVRNIRTEAEVPGLKGEWVLFNVTSDEEGIWLRFQRARCSRDYLVVENIPWMYVTQYVGKIRFQLDHTESGRFGGMQIGYPSFKEIVGTTSKIVDITHSEGFGSFHKLWSG